MRAPSIGWDATVPVSRSALYSVGALILGVSAISFVLGWAMGRDASFKTSITAANSAQRIHGQIYYETEAGRQAADSEAVVVALPADRKPDEKFPIEALRPDVAPPSAQNPTVQGVRSLGGDVARTGPHGEYELELPVGGMYFVLVISNHARRSVERPPTTTEIVEMGNYFKQADDLLGENDFFWSKQLVRANKKLDRVFGDR